MFRSARPFSKKWRLNVPKKKRQAITRRPRNYDIDSVQDSVKEAVLRALAKRGIFMDTSWVRVFSKIRTRHVKTGGYSRMSSYPRSCRYTDVVFDGKAFTLPSGAPVRVDGGTYLAFCKEYSSDVGVAWGLRINVTANVDPEQLADTLAEHPFYYSNRGGI